MTTSDLQTTFSDPKYGDARMAVWEDKAGTMHRAVGALVLPGIRLLWTKCGRHDIPANSAWLKRETDTITCEKCQQP